MLAPAMSLRELGDRMNENCQLPQLIYPGREYCYMQSPLWPGIMQDVDMSGPPFSCLKSPGDLRGLSKYVFQTDVGTRDLKELHVQEKIRNIYGLQTFSPRP